MSEALSRRSRSFLQPTAFIWSLALLLCGAAFFLPQNPTLDWFDSPLADDRRLFVQMRCAADRDAWVQLLCDTGQGYRFADSIRFPLSPTTDEFTQTFPLPDAPILHLRLTGVPRGGTLRLSLLRIVDAQGAERLRFTREDCSAENGIAAISPTFDGWAITSLPDADEATVKIDLPAPFSADGFLQRHALSALRSLLYLSAMLLIVLIVLRSLTPWPPAWPERGRHLVEIFAFAVLLGLVGNRGLIHEAFRLSYYTPPPPSTTRVLEIELNSSGETPIQLYWDIGRGINGDDSCRLNLRGDRNLQTVRFPLPRTPLRGLRLDPRDNAGFVSIRHMRIADDRHVTQAVIAPTTLRSFRDIARLSPEGGRTMIETTENATDPILGFDGHAIATINATLRSDRP